MATLRCPNPRCTGGQVNSKTEKLIIDRGTTRLTRTLTDKEFGKKLRNWIISVCFMIAAVGGRLNSIIVSIGVVLLVLVVAAPRITPFVFNRIGSELRQYTFFTCNKCRWYWSNTSKLSKTMSKRWLQATLNDLTWARKEGDKPEEHLALINAGSLTISFTEDRQKARPYLEESIKVGRSFNAPPTAHRYAVMNMGRLALIENHFLIAQELFERTYIAAILRKDLNAYMEALTYIGHTHLYQNNVLLALSPLHEALEIFYVSGRHPSIPWCLEGLAGVAVERGQLERAARLYGAAEVLKTVNAEEENDAKPQYERMVAKLRERLDADECAAAWAEGRTFSLDVAVAYALEDEAVTALG